MINDDNRRLIFEIVLSSIYKYSFRDLRKKYRVTISLCLYNPEVDRVK